MRCRQYLVPRLCEPLLCRGPLLFFILAVYTVFSLLFASALYSLVCACFVKGSLKLIHKALTQFSRTVTLELEEMSLLTCLASKCAYGSLPSTLSLPVSGLW